MSVPRLLAALAFLLVLVARPSAARDPFEALGRPMRRALAADPAPSVKTEEQLSCFVKELPAVQEFACKILYATLRRALELEMDKDTVLEHMQEERADSYNQTTYVIKPGFDEATAKKVLAEAEKAAKEGQAADTPTKRFCELTKAAGYHHTMGAFYPFTIDTDFIEGSIKASPELEATVFDNIAEAFNLDRNKITWDTLDELIDKSGGQYLLLDALNYLTSQPKSLYRHNVLNLPYIRTKRTDAVPEWSLADPAEVATCHSDLLLNQSDRVVMGNTWYSVDDTDFYSELLDSYNRTHLAGPSGSAVLLHTLFFDLLGMPKTEENLALMLSAIAGDYVPFFHSLTEILMSFSFELGKRYTLDMDPVEYVKKWAGPYWQ